MNDLHFFKCGHFYCSLLSEDHFDLLIGKQKVTNEKPNFWSDVKIDACEKEFVNSTQRPWIFLNEKNGTSEIFGHMASYDCAQHI